MPAAFQGFMFLWLRRVYVSSFNACGVQKFKNSMIVAIGAMRCADCNALRRFMASKSIDKLSANIQTIHIFIKYSFSII